MNESARQQLLEEVKSLYAQIFELALKRREESYHAANGEDVSPTLQQTLEDDVERIAEVADGKDVALKQRDGLNIPTSVHTHGPDVADRGGSDLGTWFSRTMPSSSSHAPMSVELERHAWEHVNAALRHAHDGKLSDARMQVNLATESLHELIHYVPEAEFEAFEANIQRRLDEIRDALDNGH